jgi:hypothetical protein
LRFFGAESISAVHNFSDVGGMSVGMEKFGKVWTSAGPAVRN